MKTVVTLTEAEVVAAVREFFTIRRHAGVSGVRLIARPLCDCRDQPTGLHEITAEVETGESCEPYVQGSVTYPVPCQPQ